MFQVCKHKTQSLLFCASTFGTIGNCPRHTQRAWIGWAEPLHESVYCQRTGELTAAFKRKPRTCTIHPPAEPWR